MKRSTYKLTISAIMAALTVVFLYLASVFPTGQLGFVAVASLFTIAVVIEADVKYAVLVYICCAILAFLLIPLKGAALLYTLFFGYYPIVKSFAERLKSPLWSWVVKEAVFLAALTVVWFLFRSVVFSGKYLELNPLIVYIGGIVVFTLYDIGLSRLIGYYVYRLSPKLKRKR